MIAVLLTKGASWIYRPPQLRRSAWRSVALSWLEQTCSRFAPASIQKERDRHNGRSPNGVRPTVAKESDLPSAVGAQQVAKAVHARRWFRASAMAATIAASEVLLNWPRQHLVNDRQPTQPHAAPKLRWNISVISANSGLLYRSPQPAPLRRAGESPVRYFLPAVRHSAPRNRTHQRPPYAVLPRHH